MSDSPPTADSSAGETSLDASSPGGDRGHVAPRSSFLPLPGPAALAIAALLLGVAVVLTYGWALRAPFIFDDIPTIVNNPSIMHVFPLWDEGPGSGPLWPPQDFTTAGRPLVNLSLAVNLAVAGPRPLGFHIFNLATHLLSAIILWGIVRRALLLPYFAGRFARSADFLALGVALVWALHPLQTEAVEYVTQRTELLMALCYFATLYGALRYWTTTSEGGRFGWLLLTVLSCLAGMACKEVMVTAPVVVLLFERTFVAGSLRGAVRRSWPLYLGLALTWMLLAALNIHGPRSASAGFHLQVTPLAWWCTEAKVLFVYLKLTIWPWPLVIHYDFPYLDAFSTAWPWVLAAALLAALTLVLLRAIVRQDFCWPRCGSCCRRRLRCRSSARSRPSGACTFRWRRCAALVIIGGYRTAMCFASRKEMVDDRANREAMETNRGPAIAIALFTIGIAVLFGMLSARRLTAYADPVVLWQDALPYQPDNYVVHTNLGAELINAGRYPEAIQHLSQAKSLATENLPKIHCELATALALAGRPEEAIEEYRKVLELDPNYYESTRVRHGIGISLINAGRTEEAVAEFERMVRDDPDSPDAHNYLGLALLKLGKSQEAVVQFQHAVRLLASSPQAQCNLGTALAQAGQPRQAIEHFELALRLQPNYPLARRELGRALIETNQPFAALPHLEKSLAADPKDARLHDDFGRALAGAGRGREAIVHFQTALDLGESTAAVHRHCGLAFLQIGRSTEALAQFDQAIAAQPADAESFFGAAKANAALHQRAAAITAAERAMEISRSSGPPALAAEIEAWLVEFRRRGSP